MAGASAPSPLERPASNCTRPCASLRLVPSTSLPRDISRTSIWPFGSVVASELTNTLMPSLPE